MMLHRYASDLTTHPFHVNKKMDFFQKRVCRRFQFSWIMLSHAPGPAELKKNLLYSQISLSGYYVSWCPLEGPTASQAGLRPSQAGLKASEAWLAGSEAWLAGSEAWLAGSEA